MFRKKKIHPFEKVVDEKAIALKNEQKNSKKS
jgi:hypothetical protein